ncbi:chemotaxis protein CheX [Thiospirochaeta perfilievii]|uniref:Chemotaxis protein CheX n=1 Tax=Thiospirochaeta perfilievii TaxID=252967 RepID=A0A5C1QCX5_9SPIO|nr:chemotaxis protein CheX [Thiospirochaeta perfilievii]QEN04920.1 chemotaxis protein CheX [Thiospirochaeta perfilievii]
MTANMIKPFVLYTINMFRDMFNFTPSYGKAYIVKDLELHKWEISAVVGIMGGLEGIFVIRLKRTLAFKLLNESKMVGSNSSEITNMITGMVGEFANIICGNALNLIKDLGKIDVTVPFTIQGTNHTIVWPAKGDIIAIPFNTPHGEFELQININA